MAQHHVLILGASRGLGLALAEEYLKRGSHVVATIRGQIPSALQQLMDRSDDRLAIEHVDITDRDGLHALRGRLQGRDFETIFVNAGVADGAQLPADRIPTEDFLRIMRTNVLGAVQSAEILYGLLVPRGVLAVMSSILGSVSENSSGAWNSYAASKAALNMMMRGFAARHDDDRRAKLLVAPGWVQTDMGGSGAALTVDQSIPRVVDVVEARRGTPGLGYLDYSGRSIGW